MAKSSITLMTGRACDIPEDLIQRYNSTGPVLGSTPVRAHWHGADIRNKKANL